jgi:hypothetical protein
LRVLVARCKPRATRRQWRKARRRC